MNSKEMQIDFCVGKIGFEHIDIWTKDTDNKDMLYKCM